MARPAEDTGGDSMGLQGQLGGLGFTPCEEEAVDRLEQRDIRLTPVRKDPARQLGEQ